MRNALDSAIKHKSFTSYITFVLLGIGSMFHAAEWVVLFAFIPLISYVFNIRRYKPIAVLRTFYYGGAILFALASSFLLQMSPKNWSVVMQGSFASIAEISSWLIATILCSISFLVVAMVLLKIKNDQRRVLVFPVIWMLGEILRAYIYAIISYGPGGSIGPSFNFGSAAAIAAGTPLVYIGRVVGFYGITLSVVVINISIFALIRRQYRPATIVLVGIMLLVGVGFVSDGKPQGKTAQVSLVHLNESESLDTWDKRLWPTKKPELLALPEYSEVELNPNLKKITARLAPKGLAVTSVRNVTNHNTATNQTRYFDQSGNTVNKQDKTFLIATGEYVPYILQSLFWIMGYDSVVADFNETQKLEKGTNKEYAYNNHNLKVGALSCSGITSLTEYKRLANQGADVLVNNASLSFLQPDSFYHTYARNMARFHAVYNKKPFVQASRSGQSYILDKQGRTVIENSSQRTQLLEQSISF